MNPRQTRRASQGWLAALLLFGSCAPPDSMVIETERVIRADSELVMPVATAADRFGGRRKAEAPPPVQSGVKYDVPDGWRDEGPKSMRVANLLAGEGSECYVILLGGEAGGLLANLNRWRGEVGMAPFGEAEAEALEKVKLLGQPCPLLEVEGNYQGMGGNAGIRGVLATLLVRPTGSIFVKMVGPPAEIAAHRDGFVSFVESLEEVR